MKSLWLAIRSVAMTILFPGIVAGYVPYRILTPARFEQLGGWEATALLGVFCFGIGLILLVLCVVDFARIGRGTLAPFDEPRKLVVRGLYRYVRNPMYVAVVLMLVGESCLFWAPALLAYACGVFVAFNGFVFLYEEPRLAAKYGSEYEHYRENVGRWIPGAPYR
jgi:protein-S-isoprenylcysteine O-methyltransferase Ste14